MPGNDDFVRMVRFDLFDSTAPVSSSFLRDKLDVQESALARAIAVTRRRSTNNPEKNQVNIVCSELWEIASNILLKRNAKSILQTHTMKGIPTEDILLPVLAATLVALVEWTLVVFIGYQYGKYRAKRTLQKLVLKIRRLINYYWRSTATYEDIVKQAELAEGEYLLRHPEKSRLTIETETPIANSRAKSYTSAQMRAMSPFWGPSRVSTCPRGHPVYNVSTRNSDCQDQQTRRQLSEVVRLHNTLSPIDNALEHGTLKVVRKERSCKKL